MNRQTTFDGAQAGQIRQPEYIYRISTVLYRLAAVLVLAALTASCNIREPSEASSIESWTASHAGDADFIPRARALIDSVGAGSPAQLESFVQRMADVLCKQGKQQLAASMASYPHGIDLPGDGYSLIGQRLLTRLRLTGNPAPALPMYGEGLPEATGFVVLFFESGCHSCQGIIEELAAACDSLQAAGVRIVSIASDSEPATYRTYAAKLPWKDKYCDYESFSGVYFACWGVAYTPAMYYVDGEGIVRGAYHSLQDIKDAGTPEEIPGRTPGV